MSAAAALGAAREWRPPLTTPSTIPSWSRTLFRARGTEGRIPRAQVRAVAQMGYQAVEFYAPYFEWTEPQAKQMRKLMDELGIRCYSTHNDERLFLARRRSTMRARCR